MKFIAIGLLFALLLVQVSSRVVPVWSNTTKNVDVGKTRSAQPIDISQRARLVSEYLQITVPNLMGGKTKPQNAFYWLAPQTIKTSPNFGNNEWFNSQIANDVLIAKTQKIPNLIGEPAWLPDSNSNLGLAGVTFNKPEVDNSGHSEYKLIATSAGMWAAYISLNQQLMPPAVVLGTRRDPCCAPPKGTKKLCTQTYIEHVQAMRQQFKLKPGDPEFLIYVHCPPGLSSPYYKFWMMSKTLFQVEGINILEGTCN